MSKRIIPEINAGSMADIAFLLLIFFLVTTTMDVDQGISVQLPPKVDDNHVIFQGHDRNVLEILINSKDHLMVEGEPTNIRDLTQLTKRFLTNYGADPSLSDSPLKAIISLQNDRSSSYNTYIKVQNEIKRGYNEIRNEKAKSRFRREFKYLNPAQQNEIKAQFPIKISEAEPFKSNSKL